MSKSITQNLLFIVITSLLLSCENNDGQQVVTSYPEQSTILAGDERLNKMGRMLFNEDGSIEFGYPGVSVSFAVVAQSVSFNGFSSSGNNYLSVTVDNQVPQKIKLNEALNNFPIFDFPEAGLHSVSIVHDSETWHGQTTLNSIEINNGELRQAQPLPDRRMIVIGDSITCGEGAQRLPMTGITNRNQCAKDNSWWNAQNSYGMQLASTFDSQIHLVCYGGRGLVRSWNGITDEPQGPEFYNLTVVDEARDKYWNHDKYPADLIVITLGTNDFSLMNGELPEKSDYVSRYESFVNNILIDYPKAKVLLSDGPMVNDEDDPTRPQRSVLKDYLSSTQARVNSERVQVFESGRFPGDECDGHPFKEEHRLMAEEMAPVIKRLMAW